jgi:hypothetical protein
VSSQVSGSLEVGDIENTVAECEPIAEAARNPSNTQASSISIGGPHRKEKLSTVRVCLELSDNRVQRKSVSFSVRVTKASFCELGPNFWSKLPSSAVRNSRHSLVELGVCPGLSGIETFQDRSSNSIDKISVLESRVSWIISDVLVLHRLWMDALTQFGDITSHLVESISEGRIQTH